MVKYLRIFLAVVFFFGVAQFMVQAQGNDLVIQSTASAVINPNDGVKKEIAALKNTYRDQLGIYRNDERAFVIAKEQYTKLQTLAALEEAVQATRKVMISRGQVLETYLKLLKLTLQQTTGIEIALKGKQMEELDELLLTLKSFNGKVDTSTERSKIAERVTEFVPLTKDIQNASYHSLSLITYGRMQTTYDKTLAIKQEVSDHIEKNEQNALKLGEKRRGLLEIDRNLAQLNTQLLKTRQTIEKKDRDNTESSYDSVADDMSDIYAGLLKALGFLRETLRN